MAGSHTKHAASVLAFDGRSPDSGAVAIVLRTLLSLRALSVKWDQVLDEVNRGCCCTGSTPPAGGVVASIGELTAAALVVSRVQRAIEADCQRLARYILPFDRALFGNTVGSVRELVLRGQLFVMVGCFRRLYDETPPPSVLRQLVDPVPDLLRAFPGGIGEVVEWSELEYQRITSIWAQLKPSACPPDGMMSSIAADAAALRQTAVLAAQRELNAIPEQPRFAAFLCTGLAPRQLPRVRVACARVATALQIRLAAELPLPRLRIGPVDAAAGPWFPEPQQRVIA